MGLREMLAEAARAAPPGAREPRPRRRLRRHRRAAQRGRRHGARGDRPPASTRPPRSGDQRRQELVEDVAEQRRRQLEELPPDLAGKVQSLQQYEFMDDAARQRFEELMDQLREQLMQSYFNQLSEGMQNMTPERMAADEGHAQRAQPDARAARARRGARLRRLHGAPRRLLPRQPADPRRAARADGAVDGADAAAPQLDDARAARAAAGALRVAARGHGPALAGRPALAQPAARVPEPAVAAVAELQRRRPAAVRRDAGPARHARRPRRRSRTCMRSATQPGELAEVDLDRARELLGDDAARSLDRLRELTKMLEDAGLIEQREGRLELTPRAHPRHRQQGARRPLPQAGEGPRRPPRARAHRRRATSTRTTTSPTSSATRSTSTCRRR